MKLKGKIVLVAWAVAAATACFAQRPPNDDFTNRIQLVGSSITWTGSTAGATEERYGDIPFTWGLFDLRVCADCGFGTVNSVWWSWTAQETSPVIIEKVGNLAKFRGQFGVYSTTNTFPFSDDSVIPAIDGIGFCMNGQYTIFNAEAGKEYLFRLVRVDSK